MFTRIKQILFGIISNEEVAYERHNPDKDFSNEFVDWIKYLKQNY